jgi:L-iditol 2-dehydrogenase
VVVIGAGPIGCLHVRLARGAARVLLVELSRPRLDWAAGLVAPDGAVAAGAADPVAAVLKLTGGRGAGVVIVAAASGKAQEDALRMAARRGTDGQLLRRLAITTSVSRSRWSSSRSSNRPTTAFTAPAK